jgi:hypothetical protein
MASVAFVTTEHDEADLSPTKLPRAPGLQGVRSTASNGNRAINPVFGKAMGVCDRQPISRSPARERRKKRNTEISSGSLVDSRRAANEELHGFV